METAGTSRKNDNGMILVFQCSGSEVEVFVEDIDKANLLDIIIDWLDESENQGMNTPQNPSFSYIFSVWRLPLESDRDLMKMFGTLVNRDRIYIVVEVVSEPTELMRAVTNLRNAQRSACSPQRCSPEPQPIALPNQSPTLRRSPRLLSKVADNEVVVDFGNSPTEAAGEFPIVNVRVQGRAKLDVRRKIIAGGEGLVATSHEDSRKSDSSKSSKASTMFIKKVPRTTAIRKGQVVSHVEKSISLIDGMSKCVAETPTELVEGAEIIEDIETMELSVEECDANLEDDYDPWGDCTFGDENAAGDDYLHRLYSNGEIYVDPGWGNINLKAWHIFEDKKQLRETIKDYAIQNHFEYQVERANNRFYTVICSAVGCGWRLHASVLPDGCSWAIKSISPDHQCTSLDAHNSLVNVHWAVTKLMSDVAANNDISAKTLNELLDSRYGVTMRLSTLYRVRTGALKIVNGGHDESYAYLPKYVVMVKQTNPGSNAECDWTPATEPERPLTFQRIFISFKAAIDGLLAGCRSLIGVDGAHLKGSFGGVLLCAVALDGNNQLFPFAWAVVSGEDQETWRFFVSHLKEILKDSGRGDEWTIISDRQKGIEIALNDLWLEAGRRYCCRHLSKNWQKKFRGPLWSSLFWQACNASSDFKFRKAMGEMDKIDAEARKWLTEVGPTSLWSKHAFDTKIKCNENTSNFVESFNSTLGLDRFKPVLTLLEGIRRTTMVRMATRREKSESWDDGDICPRIKKRIQQLAVSARACKAFNSGGGHYEVKDGKSVLAVSITDHTCACNVWQLTGIPCKHGVKALLHSKNDPLAYISDWYTCGKYKKAYGSSIKAIPDTEQWPDIDEPSIDPPTLKRGVGRPPKNRKRGFEEERKGKRSKTVKCGNCGHFGHNKKTCKGAPTAKEKKKQKKSSTSTSKSVSRTVVASTQPTPATTTGVRTRAMCVSQP